MSNKVAVVTDSVGTVPAEIARQLNIQIAPQVLIWNGDTYLDGVDIQPTEFYTRLKTAKIMPTTSQATPGAFAQMFKPLLEAGYDILTIVVSSKLSGTIASAEQARELYPGATIEIFDSYTAAMAQGFQVIAAASAAAEGASLAECVAVAEKARQNTGVIFAVDTLEFLHRGGRIGGASRFLGTALNIKPILEIQDGKVEPVERVRTRSKSLQRLVELVAGRVQGHARVRLSTLHANALEDAQQLYRMSQDCFEATEHLFTEVSPVIGTHTGPGTVALAYMVDL
jgi:DegV family protein with EDD domain